MSGDRIELAKGSVRRRAATTLERVMASRAPAQRLAERAALKLGPADRRLLFELVLGSLRWVRRLDWTLEVAAERTMNAIDRSLRWPLRIAAYQLLFLDRVPAYAAVDEAVREVRRRGAGRAAGFVNAVLRRVADRPRLEEWPVEISDPVRRLAVETSHPDFLVTRWVERFGQPQAAELLAASNVPKPMHLLCLVDRREVASHLGAEGVETRLPDLSPVGLEVTRGDPLDTEAFRRGSIYVQDDASQAAALIPSPQPGASVLDLAAAPGGKGFALAAAEPSVRTVANDRSLSRVLTLAENRDRLQLSLPIAVSDAVVPAFSSGFDRVVADLPCSGTGTLARHPEIKWRLSPERVDRLADRGLAMLREAATLVEPGGVLCAITCSLEAEENEVVMDRFYEEHSQFEPLPLEGRVDPSLVHGVQAEGMWRVPTAARHDGFTVHVARRVDSH